MSARFLDTNEALDYLAEQCSDPEGWHELNHMSIIKVFPGKSYVLFSKTGKETKVHSILQVNVVTMDREGLCIIMRELMSGQSLRIGYIPIKLQVNDQKVYLSIPVRCKFERTLRQLSSGKVAESVALGMLIRQKADRYNAPPPGVLMLVGYEEFKSKTGRVITELER